MTDTTTAHHAFDADTAVERIGEGRYATVVSAGWDALGGGPNGGYTLALCQRALADALPHPDPLVVSGWFLRPPAHGPAEIAVEVARTGKRLATGGARLLQDGEEVARAVATFTDLAAAEGPTDVRNEPPVLPAPEECRNLLPDGPLPGVTITERVEYRMPELPGWMRGAPSGEPRAEFWMRFADGREPDVLALAPLTDAGWPVVLDLGVRASITVELTAHVRARPAPGWLACRVTTRHVSGGFHEEDFEIWDSAGRLVAQSRQLGLIVT